MKNVIFGILGALALLGCGGGGGGGSSSSSKARVAFLNASPDAGSVAFSLDASVQAPSVAFGTGTDFQSVKAGDDDVSVSATDDASALWSESHTLTSNADTLVVAVGLRTPPSDTTQTPPVVELDKRLVLSFSNLDRTVPNGNTARIFIVHAYVRQAGYPTPSIDFRNPGDTSVVEQDGIAFGSIVAKDVDSGTQSFEVRQTNTNQTLIAAQDFVLAPGKIYVALVSGVEGATGTSAPAVRLIPLATRS